MITPGLAQFKLSYEISPIYLTGGVAGQIGGGFLPLLALTQGALTPSLLGGVDDNDLDNFFAHFVPLSGAALVNNQVGEYPFANQATAANALITQPLTISMLMICPARNPGDYTAKAAVISALKATLDSHNISGGLYVIATPSFLYTDCVMTGMHDASSGESKQSQWRWQLDFRKPLISLQDAAVALNAQMSKLNNGVQVTPNANGQLSWSGPSVGVGNSASGAAPSIAPTTGASPALGFSGSDSAVGSGVGGGGDGSLTVGGGDASGGVLI